jgi:cbb3-type cytochrome oxidase subunit 1
VIRVAGGLLYLGGMMVMAWNVWDRYFWSFGQGGHSRRERCPRLSPKEPIHV